MMAVEDTEDGIKLTGDNDQKIDTLRKGMTLRMASYESNQSGT